MNQLLLQGLNLEPNGGTSTGICLEPTATILRPLKNPYVHDEHEGEHEGATAG